LQQRHLGSTPEKKAKEKRTRQCYLAKNAVHISETLKHYRNKNKKACADRVKKSRAKKPQQYIDYCKRWAAQNRKRVKLLAQLHRKQNPGLYREYKIKRRIAFANAIPKWANIQAIRAIYAKAAEIPGQHVDHIVPLLSPLVCGLHWEGNLQIIPAGDNMIKSNRYWPDMPM